MRGKLFLVAVGFVFGLMVSAVFHKNSTPPQEVAALETTEKPSVNPYASAEPKITTPVPVLDPKASQTANTATANTTSQSPPLTATHSSVADEVKGLLAKGKRDEARNRLMTAIQARPNDPGLKAELGFFYLNTQMDAAKALPYFEQSLKLDGNNEEVLNSLVDLSVGATEQSVRERSSKMLQANASANPNSAEAQLAWADLVRERKNLPEAEKLYQNAARLDNKGALLAHQRLGEMSLQSGNFSRAVEEFGSAKKAAESELEQAKQTGQDVEFHAKRVEQRTIDHSMALMTNGQLREAEEMIMPVYKAKPDDVVLQRLLQDIRARQNGITPAVGLPRAPGRPTSAE